MARRLRKEDKDLGGNPNKFMGTKTNINFLGKGPKESLFQGQIDIDGLMRSGFPIERVVGEAETAGSYAVANKLNDLQLQRLEQNLITLKKAYFPEQIPNITDLGTRTGGLTQEGLGSLRGGKTIADELAAAEGVETGETILPMGGLMTRIQDRMKNIKEMSDKLGRIAKGETTKPGAFRVLDPTAEKSSYASKFNPKNEVHVNKAKALLEDPQIKGLYTEAEVKNAWDFEGLYQSHFDKGHVDVAVLFEQAGHNIPQMRASARSALLDLMKKQRGVPGSETGLRDFVSDVDFKFISEGGGGREGDPINLFVKYFGRNAAENLPKNATKENIDAFTDFVVKARDRRGRGIDDPFFDRESIDFSEFTRSIDDYVPPFKTGGRVGFRLGGFGGKFTKAQVLLARLKNTVRDSAGKTDETSVYVNETFPNFIKEIEANPKLAENENVWKALGIGGLPKDQRLVVHGDDTVDFFRQTSGPGNIDRITAFLEKHPLLTREEAIRIMKMEPEDRILEITRLETIRRTPNASGGLAKILEV
jgi:hypothetical protein